MGADGAGHGEGPAGTPGAAAREGRDDALGEGFRAGDLDCFDEAFRRWSPLVYTFCRRALADVGDAEDVTQQVFLGAWTSRESFDPQRSSLPGWLVGITRHRIVDRQRLRDREQRSLRAAVEGRRASGVEDEAELGPLVDRLVLAEAIQQLPHPRGTVIRLAFWEGYTYPQIAERLDLPLGTVKSHARRALLHLRDRLREVTS